MPLLLMSAPIAVPLVAFWVPVPEIWRTSFGSTTWPLRSISPKGFTMTVAAVVAVPVLPRALALPSCRTPPVRLVPPLAAGRLTVTVPVKVFAPEMVKTPMPSLRRLNPLLAAPTVPVPRNPA